MLTLLLFAAAAVGFGSWFWRARALTGDAVRDQAPRRTLRVTILVSFALLAAALLASLTLRPNVR